MLDYNGLMSGIIQEGEPTNNAIRKLSASGSTLVNPLDLEPQDVELEKEDWICVSGHYEKGRIICKVPTLIAFNAEALNYNVDVSLNG